MRHQLRALLIATASVVQCTATAVFAADGPPAPPATRPAAESGAAVPVKQVVLFSTGVGYFEHYGTVDGNGSTELRFKTAQINDILKSLLLEDLDKGRVAAVNYPSQNPIGMTLRSFQVDITANPSLGDLLNQLRGAIVQVSSGGRELTGTILGVEKKTRPMGDKGQVAEAAYLNLIADANISQVPLDDVHDVRLRDPKLQDELHRALLALSAARDQDKKPVTIRFTGQGKRRLRIGYVVETPVWKTSYRLVLNDVAQNVNDGAGVPATAPGILPATRPAGDAGQAAAVAGAGGKLQGWAIIENQTDNDWNDVELSLVSGRPISFIQDLYQPRYIPRPLVQPELFASLRPQTYEGGIEARQKRLDEFAGSGRALQEQKEKTLAAKDSDAIDSILLPTAEGLTSAPPLDPTASVKSVASAAKVGEMFQYTVGDVSLPRQTSAMIPIIADGIETEKLSIYNRSVLPRNPLRGARLKNTTGKHLPGGPLTVLEGGSYAGDAQVEDLPPGQDRLISYGIDQQLLVDSTHIQQNDSVLSAKIDKGVLTLSRKHVFTQEYVSENKGDRARTLIIEHPRHGGDWTLLQPAKADETTDVLFRFKGTVAAGKASKLLVEEQRVAAEQLALLPADIGQLLSYIRLGEISQPVKDALGKAVELKQRVTESERAIQSRVQEIQQTTAEQARLRENMKTVAATTDYYKRLLKKLDEQETGIEKLQGEIRDLQKTQERQKQDLSDYLSQLTVAI